MHFYRHYCIQSSTDVLNLYLRNLAVGGSTKYSRIRVKCETVPGTAGPCKGLFKWSPWNPGWYYTVFTFVLFQCAKWNTKEALKEKLNAKKHQAIATDLIAIAKYLVAIAIVNIHWKSRLEILDTQNSDFIENLFQVQGCLKNKTFCLCERFFSLKKLKV